MSYLSFTLEYSKSHEQKKISALQHDEQESSTLRCFYILYCERIIIYLAFLCSRGVFIGHCRCRHTFTQSYFYIARQWCVLRVAFIYMKQWLINGSMKSSCKHGNGQVVTKDRNATQSAKGALYQEDSAILPNY